METFLGVSHALNVLGKNISFGTCSNRCLLPTTLPIGYVWLGITKASDKQCPECGSPLERVSRWTWACSVQQIP